MWAQVSRGTRLKKEVTEKVKMGQLKFSFNSIGCSNSLNNHIPHNFGLFSTNKIKEELREELFEVGSAVKCRGKSLHVRNRILFLDTKE